MRNIRLLELELDEKPKDSFLHFNLGNAYLDIGHTEKGVGFLKRCLELSPKKSSYLPKVYFMLAGGSHLMNRYDEAARYCHEGISAFPESVELWFQEGTLKLTKKDWAGPKVCFETILELPRQGSSAGMDPELPAARTRHNLAFVYPQLGESQKAEKQWHETIESCPTFASAWLSLLELFLDQKRHREVSELLQRLQDNPNRQTIQPACWLD